jgi:serine/threonine-protein kinase HipA
LGSVPVLDVGCGPGKQTLVLARELDVPILAIDFHEPFLEQVRQRARAAGLDHLITARRAGMEALEFPPGSLDLIWAEGSIYIIGFATGLSLWRPLLRDGGLVVASELTWLSDDPPAEARAFWQEGYPHMTDVASNIRNAAAVGFKVFDHFVLPQQAWWDEYLTPLSERAEILAAETRDPELLAVIAEQNQETDICRRFGEHFGYVFYLMRKTDMPAEQECAHA